MPMTATATSDLQDEQHCAAALMRQRRRRRSRRPCMHLVPELAPDRLVQLVEARQQPDLGASRGRGRSMAMVADDARGGPRRHDHHAVGQRDRLLEVVGDEQHGLAVAGPQLEQQVAHDLRASARRAARTARP